MIESGEFVDAKLQRPKKVVDVELLFEDGSTALGYYHPTNKGDDLWIGEDGYLITDKEVVGWKYTLPSSIKNK